MAFGDLTDTQRPGGSGLPCCCYSSSLTAAKAFRADFIVDLPGVGRQSVGGCCGAAPNIRAAGSGGLATEEDYGSPIRRRGGAGARRRPRRQPQLTGPRERRERVRVLSATRLLLNANVSTAYLPDHNQGMYPIHVAASAGCLESVKALLEICPDCATLRDAKGRTFLHSAAEKARFCVVRYVVRSRKSGLSCILNMQDNNGDTALHRAVHAGDLGVVSVLIVCRQDPRIHIRTSLLAVGAPYGENRGDLFDEKQTSVTPKFKGGEEKISENLTSAAQVLALFSILITTVTFASAFTLPGGYRSAGDGGGAAGTPVLAGSYAFDAFILADALAFLCSFLATSVLLYAGVPAYPLETRFRNINCAYGLMMNSGRCLVAALALGLYVVLLPPHAAHHGHVGVWCRSGPT
ncbi:hypothetical protein E2562_012252 [Oryza meyeriana var. granulata]|uniref:PGG domain-containing protein n=1 Tax=Oryza meyeriana var. granulata TaxID=110450 RepID=A0A6G1D1V7_9ORYZ|nr:hypothetical protein E2562_012252 [Oryza meyeriana var. granulata]